MENCFQSIKKIISNIIDDIQINIKFDKNLTIEIKEKNINDLELINNYSREFIINNLTPIQVKHYDRLSKIYKKGSLKGPKRRRTYFNLCYILKKKYDEQVNQEFETSNEKNDEIINNEINEISDSNEETNDTNEETNDLNEETNDLNEEANHLNEEPNDLNKEANDLNEEANDLNVETNDLISSTIDDKDSETSIDFSQSENIIIDICEKKNTIDSIIDIKNSDNSEIIEIKDF